MGTTLSNSLFENLYKDFIGAQDLTERLNLFYDGGKRNDSFPPYNIIEYENGKYEIQIALAGYAKSEITLENENNTLVVLGKKEAKAANGPPMKWIWGGIAQRNFERRFMLEDNIKVVDAEMDNGILTINLQKFVPEKPKSALIAIK